MKKSLTSGMILFILTFFSFTAFAQNIFNQDWITSSGNPNGIYDFQASHVMGNDQGIVIVGNTFHAGQAENFLISRYRNDGTLVFKKEYDGTASATDFATDVTTIGKNIYVTGVEGDTSTGVSYITTLKLDSIGNIIWTTKYQNAYGKYNLGFRIIPDPTGANLYVCGTSQTGVADFALTLLKYKEIGGSPTWIASYDSVGLYDAGIDLKCNTSQVIVYGISGLSSTSGDIIVRAYNASTGGLQSQSRINNTGIYVTRPVAIAKDNAENIYLAGVSNDIAKMDDIVIVKLDSLLNPKWRKYIDGGNSKNDAVTAIKVDSKNNLILSGFAGNADASKSVWTLKMKDSVIVWDQRRPCNITGKNAVGNDVDLDRNDNVYVTGTIYTGARSEIITMKYDSTGFKKWEDIFSLNVESNDEGRNVRIDSGGNIIVYGRSKKDSIYTYVTTEYSQDSTPIPPVAAKPALEWTYYKNIGQVKNTSNVQDSTVLYYTSTANPRLYISPNKLSYVYNKKDSLTDSLMRVDMVFYYQGSEPKSSNIKYYSTEKNNQYLNYYQGGYPKFYEGIHGNQRITAKNIYKNIDWQAYSDSGGLKYYLVLSPGANPSDIQLKYLGASAITLNSNRIIITTPYGTDTQAVFSAMQFTGTTPTSVSVTCNSLGSNLYGFSLGTYNTAKPLFIQINQNPTPAKYQVLGNLDWSTYLGGSGDDWARDIDIDNNHQKFVTGNTSSPNFPSTTGTPFSNSAAVLGSFLTKFDSSGIIQYSTFYGGSSFATPSIIQKHLTNAVAAGRWTSNDGLTQTVYIAGQTAISNLPCPKYTPFGTGLNDTLYHGGGADGFVARFNGYSGALKQASYVGSNGEDALNTLEIDINSNHNPNALFVGGYTMGTNFPFQNTQTGNFYASSGGGVLMQLDPNMKVLCTTGFGSSSIYRNGNDSATCSINDIKLDNVGNIVLVGTSWFAFPTGSPYNITQPIGSFTVSSHPSHTYSPPSNQMLAKFTPVSGTNNKYQLFYFSEFGDDEPSRGEKICTNSHNDIFIGGFGQCNYLPNDTSFDYIEAGLGSDGGLVVKFDQNGKLLAIGDYGGVGSIIFGDMFCDDNDNLYLYGNDGQSSPNFSLLQRTGWFYDAVTSTKAFLACITPDNVLNWSTMFGGQRGGQDRMGGMCIDGNGLYICGKTPTSNNATPSSTDFPLRDNGVSTYYAQYSGSTGDAYVARFNLLDYHPLGLPQVKVFSSNLRCFPNPSNGHFTVTFEDFGFGNKTVTLYNYLGQIVNVMHTFENRIEIIANETSETGVYIVEVSSASKKDVAKVVISK